MAVRGPSPICSLEQKTQKKKSGGSSGGHHWGKPGDGKQFISLKIECPSWTRWGSASFVTGSGGFVYKQGRRKAGKMFSLNFLLETMTFKRKASSSTVLEQQEAPSPQPLFFI